MLAFRERIPLMGLVRYAAMLAVLGGTAAAGGGWLMGQLAETADHSIQVTVDEDLEPVAPPRVSGTAATSSAATEDADTAPFEHARSAPRLFERVSDVEAERIKASVRDKVVADGPEDWYRGNGHTFHTVCVRLCDGAYFPISYSTTRDRFASDEAACKSRCAAPARLFVWANPGGAPETMRDRRGGSYVALPTAFQFRRGKTAGCSCRPEAWEEASISRHAQYARDEAGPMRVAKTATSAAQVAGWRSDEKAAGAASASDADHLRAEAVRAEVAVMSATAEAAPLPSLSSAQGRLPKTASRLAATAPALSAVEAKPIGAGASAVVVSGSADQARDGAPVPPLPDAKPEGVRQAYAVAAKGARKRRPAAPIDAVAISTLASAANASLASTELATNTGLPKQRKNWGIGPNAASAPRGHTAYDVFARNFY